MPENLSQAGPAGLFTYILFGVSFQCIYWLKIQNNKRTLLVGEKENHD